MRLAILYPRAAQPRSKMVGMTEFSLGLSLGNGVVPHVVGDFPIAIGLFFQNVQEGSGVRGACRLAALHGRPSDFIGAPGVSELAVTADTLQSHNQLGDFGGRGV